MKTIYVIILFGVFLNIPTLEAQIAIKQDTSSVATKDTLVYKIYGMDCPGCQQGLEKQVNKIPSVAFSKADWLKQELRIVLKKDSILNRDELEKRVRKANFTLGKEK